MKIGSLVETVWDFSEARRTWGLPYPKLGEVLTVCKIEAHHQPTIAAAGIVLLHFEELPSMPGLCDFNVHGKPNFVELLLPPEIEELLSKPKATPLTLDYLWEMMEKLK